MKKIKIIALAIMLAFLVTVPGFVNADEAMLTPNKLVVFKISDYNYYTQDIGSDKVLMMASCMGLLCGESMA